MKSYYNLSQRIRAMFNVCRKLFKNIFGMSVEAIEPNLPTQVISPCISNARTEPNNLMSLEAKRTRRR